MTFDFADSNFGYIDSKMISLLCYNFLILLILKLIFCFSAAGSEQSRRKGESAMEMIAR